MMAAVMVTVLAAAGPIQLSCSVAEKPEVCRGSFCQDAGDLELVLTLCPRFCGFCSESFHRSGHLPLLWLLSVHVSQSFSVSSLSFDAHLPLVWLLSVYVSLFLSPVSLSFPVYVKSLCLSLSLSLSRTDCPTGIHV